MWLALLVFIEICLMGSVISPYSRHSLFSQKVDFLSLLNTFNTARKPPRNQDGISPRTRKFRNFWAEKTAGAVRSCDDVKKSGVYAIDLPSFTTKIYMRCETGFDHKNGNWMVIQLRVNGEVDFYRSWKEYADGFGKLENEFFYGLDNILNIINGGPMELGIMLNFTNGRSGYAIYHDFQIGTEDENFRLLHLGSMTGDIGDALHYHLGQPFSTYDRKNDGHDDENCALSYRGGWWYRQCYQSNLNGVYPFRREDCEYCARWNTFHKKEPLVSIMMALREGKFRSRTEKPR